MRIGSLAQRDLFAHLRGPGIGIEMGPFVARVCSDIADVAAHIAQMYVNHRCAIMPEFSDFHVRVGRPRGPRRWVRQQALFFLDNESPFKPLPIEQAFPMLEWGLNWCISNLAHQFLIIHAAVVERDGRALMLPAEPGAGKSTLCAALVNRGWRLFSDELALISPETKCFVPLARPVNLKNESIAVIHKFAPKAEFTRPFADTSKGTVALMRPPCESVMQDSSTANPGWIVSPRYEPGAGCHVAEESKGRMLIHLADLSFNYSLLGAEGFELVAYLTDRMPSFKLVYDDLDSAVDELERLAHSAEA